MRVKLKTLMAGPAGVSLPGAEVELPDDQARQMVETGQAEAVEAKAEAEAEIETAALTLPETAVKPRPRRKPKPKTEVRNA